MGKTSNKKVILGIMIAAVFILGILTIDFASADHPQNAGYRFTQFVEDLASHFPITSVDILDDTITSADIADGTITADDLAPFIGPINLGTSALQFNDSTETISVQSGDMIFDVPTTDFFSFDVAGTPQMRISGSQINILANTLTLDLGRSIVGSNSGITQTVRSDDSFEFVVVSTGTMVQIDATGLDVQSSGTVQEASVDISPIGRQEVFIYATDCSPGANAPAEATITMTNNAITGYALTVNDIVICPWQTPTNYDANVNLVVTIYWTSSTGTTTETATFAIAAQAFAHGDTLDNAYATGTAVAADALTATESLEATASTTLAPSGTDASGNLIMTDIGKLN